MADDFNEPFGPNGNVLWWLNRQYMRDPAQAADGFNKNEVQVFKRSAIGHAGSTATIRATYDPGVAPAENGYGVRNYVSGCMCTAPHPGQPGFQMYLARGGMFAIEVVWQPPRNVSGEMWAAVFLATNPWVEEWDIEEYRPEPNTFDSNLIFQTNPKDQDYFYGTLGWDVSSRMHRTTGLWFPNGSWQVYVDGAIQSWVGNAGRAPARTVANVPTFLTIDYALRHNAWTEGSEMLHLDSVAVYSDSSEQFEGGGIAPGTVVG